MSNIADSAEQITVDIASVIRHNAAIIEGTSPLSITTPSQPWSYAAEFQIPQAAEKLGPQLEIQVAIRNVEGTIGIGCLDAGGSLLGEIFASDAPQAQTLRLNAVNTECTAVILRNASSSIRPSRVEILSIVLSDPTEREHESKQETELFVNADSLRHFKPWSGTTPAGYWTDWLGVRTRSDVWAFLPDAMAVYGKERFESPSIPTDEEGLLDWLPLIDAVAAAGDTFVMVALGAGWGRWLTGGAFAARQSNRDYRLVGVEAEPTHFEWMVRHFSENGLDPSRYTLVKAAAARREGDCWFMVGNSTAWYGQSIMPESEIDADLRARVPLWSETTVNNQPVQRVRCVDLKSIANGLPVIDYLHMDIQGAEADVLTAHPDVLTECVRMVNVGTHSHEIEQILRELFSTLEWQSVYDIPLNTTVKARLGDAEPQTIQFGDGVQVWVNPRLARN